MKKTLLGILVLALALVGFTACGKKKEEEKKETEKPKTNYLVLVNKENKLPDNWEDTIELVSDKDAWGDEVKVEKEALAEFKKLQAELKNEGIEIELDSIYRSVAEQQDLWDRWSADPEKGPEYVKKYVAVPGYSEHHTGLAIDVCLKIKGEIVADNDEMIKQKKIWKTVHPKLADYGFILRYPDGKKDITGYAYEPWHFRYVGSKEIAHEIMDNDLTFEEYLESKKESK